MTDIATPPRRKIRWLAEIRGLLGIAVAVIGTQSLIAKLFYIPSESMMPTLQVGDRLVVSKWPYGWSYASISFRILPFMKGRLLGRLPERGDIVIVTPPDAARRGKDFIKRVVGLPGDTVRMVDSRLWLNGRPVHVQDMGYRMIPIDANDPDPERAFPGFAHARVSGTDGRLYCRLHFNREMLPNGCSYDTLDFGHGEEDDFGPYIVPTSHVFLLGDNRDESADSRVPVDLNGLGGAVPMENIGGRGEFISFSLKGDATWNPLSWLGGLRADRAGIALREGRAQ